MGGVGWVGHGWGLLPPVCLALVNLFVRVHAWMHCNAQAGTLQWQGLWGVVGVIGLKVNQLYDV